MVGDMITYYLPINGISGQGKERKMSGPYVAQIMAGYRRDVPDEEVREYIAKMHGVTDAVIKRKGLGS